MKNPTLLKANVTADEAIELIDYLYCERTHHIGSYKDESNNMTYITWFENEKNNSCFAKWTEAYKNIMISKDFLENK